MNLAQLQHEEISPLGPGCPGLGETNALVSTAAVHAPVAHVTTAPQPTVAWRGPAMGRMSLAVARLPLVWMVRMRQRRALMRLDDRLLADVGLSRGDALEEFSKPFWRA